MQRMAALCLAVVCFLSFLSASPAEAETMEERIQRLERMINQLQGELVELKNEQTQKIEKVEQEQQAQAEKDEQLRVNLGKVYKKAMAAENAVLDKVEIGAFLENTAYWLDYENKDTDETDSLSATPASRLELKLKAKLTDEIKFHTTLSMYKLWGADTYAEFPNRRDLNENSYPSDSGVGVSRAYLDYRPKWLDQRVNFEVGRLPTNYGLSSSFRYDLPRLGAYPDLAFNAESDGAALTFYLHDWLPLESPALTVVYGKQISDVDGTPFRDDNMDVDDSTVMIGQFETGLPFLKRSSLVLNWLHVFDVRPPDITSYTPYNTVEHMPDSLGDLDKLTAYFEMLDIADSGLDMFVSGSVLFSDPKNDPAQFSYAHDPALLVLAQGGLLPPDALQAIPDSYVGLLTDDNQDSHTGTAFHAGLRYKLPFESILNPKIGVEYNWGSEYWNALNYGAQDPRQKLNVRGWAFEGYYVQPLIEDLFKLRLGYQFIHRDYTTTNEFVQIESIYGQPTETDINEQIWYLSTVLSF